MYEMYQRDHIRRTGGHGGGLDAPHPKSKTTYKQRVTKTPSLVEKNTQEQGWQTATAQQQHLRQAIPKLEEQRAE
jgi:hypothetical protein